MKFDACVKSMRLRTLPLSESGVLMGLFLALQKGTLLNDTVRNGCAGFLTAFFLVLTAALLQILSNLSNELGDTLSGADTAERQGIHYSLQDGEMTIPQMKKLIVAVLFLCCLSGLAMIIASFGLRLAPEPVILVLLGAAAIWAAMHYTLGRNPYGYRGLGDVFVFIFFGLVSVFGSYFICSHDFCNLQVLLPAAGIGCFSVAVLNVNNIRDMKTDMGTRTTLAIKLGIKRARVYQIVLIALGWLLLLCFTVFNSSSWFSWLYVATVPLFVRHLNAVWTREDRSLDRALPLLVMSTFLTVMIMGFGIIL